MLSRADSQALLERCVALSRADEVRVSLSQDDTSHLRFARNTPSTSGVAETTTLSVRSTFGRKSGTATVNQLDTYTVEGVVRRAEEIAQVSPEDPEHVPELGEQEYARVDTAPHEELEARLDHMATGAGLCMDAARAAGLVAAGFAQVSDGVRALGNSAGLFGYQRVGRAAFSETVRTPDGTGSGWASTAARNAGGLDYETTSRTAIEKARRSAQPRQLEPGDHPAILEPACVANLLRLLLGDMDARSADEGRSAFAREGGTRLGEQLFPEFLDVRSDPTDGEVAGVPWGADGTARRPTRWIDAGRVASLATSRFWAAETGTEPLPSARSARMAGGERTLAELIASTERAILCTNFWYMRGLDPQTLAYTGLTRDGVFLVEDGEITRPLTNYRWNDSPIRVFANALELSQPARVGGRGGRSESYVVPGMRVSGFGFASISEAV